jgi:hypothetical protein
VLPDQKASRVQDVQRLGKPRRFGEDANSLFRPPPIGSRALPFRFVSVKTSCSVRKRGTSIRGAALSRLGTRRRGLLKSCWRRFASGKAGTA